MKDQSSLKSHWRDTPKLLILGIIVSMIFSSWIMLQNWQIQRENDEIKHAHNVETAVAFTGLRITAQKLETGYKSQKMRESRYIQVNQQSPCSALPGDLAVAEPDVEYVPPEAVFMQMGQSKENHDN